MLNLKEQTYALHERYITKTNYYKQKTDFSSADLCAFVLNSCKLAIYEKPADLIGKIEIEAKPKLFLFLTSFHIKSILAKVKKLVNS